MDNFDYKKIGEEIPIDEFENDTQDFRKELEAELNQNDAYIKENKQTELKYLINKILKNKYRRK